MFCCLFTLSTYFDILYYPGNKPGLFQKKIFNIFGLFLGFQLFYYCHFYFFSPFLQNIIRILRFPGTKGVTFLRQNFYCIFGPIKKTILYQNFKYSRGPIPLMRPLGIGEFYYWTAPECKENL